MISEDSLVPSAAGRLKENGQTVPGLEDVVINNLDPTKEMAGQKIITPPVQYNKKLPSVLMSKSAKLNGNSAAVQPRECRSTSFLMGEPTLGKIVRDETFINIKQQTVPPGYIVDDGMASSVRSSHTDFNSSTPSAVPRENKEDQGTTTQDNMTMMNSESGMRFMIRNCVKNTIFPSVKFWNKENPHYENYGRESNSLCGRVMSYCNFKMDEMEGREWWENKGRKLTKAAITNQRNNYIKSMGCRFKGKNSQQ